MEQIINFLLQAELPFFVIWLVAFAATLTENLCPPAPGDTLVIFIGALVGFGKVDFFSALLFATLGSTAGFAVMFLLGRYFGRKMIASPHFKFINEESMKKPNAWFARWGYWLVAANRFLSGTRAVISFAAGMTEMRFDLTIVLSAVSSLVWNSILLFSGKIFGSNWKLVDHYFAVYGRIIVPVIIVGVIVYFTYKYLKKKKMRENI